MWYNFWFTIKKHIKQVSVIRDYNVGGERDTRDTNKYAITVSNMCFDRKKEHKRDHEKWMEEFI